MALKVNQICDIFHVEKVTIEQNLLFISQEAWQKNSMVFGDVFNGENITLSLLWHFSQVVPFFVAQFPLGGEFFHRW